MDGRGRAENEGHRCYVHYGQSPFQAGFIGFNEIKAVSASYLKAYEGKAAE